MVALLIIVAVVFALFLASVLACPEVKLLGRARETFWVAPTLGVFAILVCGLLTPFEIMSFLTADTAVNPLKILVLFFSMTVISVYLDEAGFFQYLANRTAARAKGSQLRFFVSLYVVISVFTVFTSNDIIILTFTPFICYFCRHADISPRPYLIMEFVAANTWSMFLMIGNPTNIYLATAHGINFVEYMSVMALPTIVAGIVSFVVIYMLFRHSLKQPMSYTPTDTVIADKFLTTVSFVTLVACILVLAVASFVPALEMWLVALVAALVLIVIVLVYRAVRHEHPENLVGTMGRLPWLLVPFVLCMFVIVQALTKYGVTAAVSNALDTRYPSLVYGIVAYLSANILNNIPMSVLFAGIASADIEVYAVIIASNLGAVLTPVGALAGIMWSGIIRQQGVQMSVRQFIACGAAVSIPALICALLVL